MKTTTEGRQRAKQKMIEEKLLRDRQNELEEEKRMYGIILSNRILFTWFTHEYS